jgi:hypothetical protein
LSLELYFGVQISLLDFSSFVFICFYFLFIALNKVVSFSIHASQENDKDNARNSAEGIIA